MKKLILAVALSLMIVTSAVAAPAVFTLLDAATVPYHTAIDTAGGSGTVCATDSGVLQIVTQAVHGLSVNSRVSFTAGTLCTGLVSGTEYWVTQVDTTKKFNISATKGGTPLSWTDNGVGFNSFNDTGKGEVVSLGNDYSKLVCYVSWSGNDPTSTVVTLWGSFDGVVFDEMDASRSITSDGQHWNVNEQTSTYLKGEYVSRVGGDATTAVTFKCMPGRN